ncbi:TetR/AcrR family transcriptional regulator [Streptomyces stelliscabiei]|uniref:TetR/AcrR family transcriptional regulator n=1 Tax=Streptomyces stelliscabiei TaxID=146820 RepID=UPI0029BBEBE5|nr:TetR/AcrR family transcriptional regulator [Streptomyces stelliscabiei]MDX2552106.1 TetR/AcrR family transcriptional regulator [Streptomyces stelliscabiei]MDX2609526.1 TetR/AcrR family transcriptional regulator [Streptomyces stelliscabiei]MDX2636729.1 TetR/AcrR family transcriptional regulator [Streptomyces stelliscabiei]MDX2660161.1 TetR/AcrR family transcriptional regulator [Streptomyces stelliscabiei]MDX2710806.1 TetR/AcrR family transcriptional regulator [Streptomyces stelliscabiei]
MAKSSPAARERIVAGAADMISRRGLNATSIRETAKHARAPLGSTYHYFPEGKQQLATEAVRYTGEWVARRLRRELEAGPVAGLRAFLDLWRKIVVDSDFRAGCPVLAVSIEEPATDETPAALVAAADVFGAWENLLADSLCEHGAEREQAAQLATLVVAAVEGTVAMCRAKRSTQPLDRTAEQLQALVLAAIKG